MKKKTPIIVVCAVCAVLLAFGGLAVYAISLDDFGSTVVNFDIDPEATPGEDDEPDFIVIDPYEGNWTEPPEDEDDDEPGEPSGLYEECYAVATEEQREQLENIVVFENWSRQEWYTKQIMIIMDMLPEDTPCITLEQAQAICAEIDPYDYDTPDEFENVIVGRFNEIAGAPDFDGGSGITRKFYFLDNNQTEYLVVTGCFVEYVDSSGSRTFLLTLRPLSEEN